MSGHDQEEAPRTGIVQSIDRAMTILEIIGRSESGSRLSDIARLAGLSPSTTHRLLTTLQQRRYIQSDPRNGRWHIGLPLLSIGLAFLDRSSFVAPAMPLLKQLRDETKETVNLGVSYDGEIVVLAQVASRQIMRAITRVGGHVPMTTSAMGKAILATLPSSDVEDLIELRGLKRKTPQSIVQPLTLEEELALIRSRGYAIDNREFDAKVKCAAAVVYNDQAEAVCAISVSGVTQRLSDERVGLLGERVVSAANQITRTIGGRRPHEPLPETLTSEKFP